MKTKYLLFLVAFVSLIGFTGCEDEDENNEMTVAADVVSVTNITYKDAVVTGMIVGDSELVTEYGFCYGISMDPTVDDSNVEFTGEEFVATIPLKSNTTYYLRSYVKTDSEIIYSANRYFTTPKVNVILLEESFETEIPSTWTTIDKDGDGFGWAYSSSAGGCARSQSYDAGNWVALWPENYLVSPMISIPDNITQCELKFDVASGWLGYHQDVYRVVASTEPITFDNCQNATVVKPNFTLTDAYAGVIFNTEVADLASFKGKDVYFAIVHADCGDLDRFFLKNVEVRAFE